MSVFALPIHCPRAHCWLAVLMDKGIFIGVEYEAATRTNLSFTMFRQVTSVRTQVECAFDETDRLTMQSHLFLYHVLLYHLMNGQVREAVLFASNYQHLVYFAHALEMTLHNVVEEDVTALQGGDDSEKKKHLLADTIEFLDHFDICLDVVVGCARKIEMTRWARLFDIVGDPKDLFEVSRTSRLDRRLVNVDSVVLVLQATEDSRVLPPRTAWT